VFKPSAILKQRINGHHVTGDVAEKAEKTLNSKGKRAFGQGAGCVPNDQRSR